MMIQTVIGSTWATRSDRASAILTPVIYYGNIFTLTSQGSGYNFPLTNVYSFQKDYQPGCVYNYSLGIQQALQPGGAERGFRGNQGNTRPCSAPSAGPTGALPTVECRSSQPGVSLRTAS
jgi:hypothetical protein